MQVQLAHRGWPLHSRWGTSFILQDQARSGTRSGHPHSELCSLGERAWRG